MTDDLSPLDEHWGDLNVIEGQLARIRRRQHYVLIVNVVTLVGFVTLIWLRTKLDVLENWVSSTMLFWMLLAITPFWLATHLLENRWRQKTKDLREQRGRMRIKVHHALEAENDPSPTTDRNDP